MLTWIKRWKKTGYRELWHRHYGGAHEGDKGCDREYNFMLEVTSGWRDAYQSERSLRLEAETLLRDNGIEPPTDKRDRQFIETMEANKARREAAALAAK
jgi:hypothetical protein